MNTRGVKDRVKRVLTREGMVDCRPDEVDDRADLIGDIGMDSIQVIEFVVGLETEFGVSFAEEDIDLDVLRNVESVVAFVRKKLAVTREA